MAELFPHTVKEPWTVDGNLLSDFKQYGYEARTWIPGRVRNIPRSLAHNAEQSGCQFAVVTDGMPEDTYREPGPHPQPKDAAQLYRERFSKEPKMRVMLNDRNTFTDGALSPMFAALDMEPWIGAYEILELPVTLVQACQRSGAELTSDGLDEFEGQPQVKYSLKRDAYRQEQAERRKAEEAKRFAQDRASFTLERARQKIAKTCKLTPDELEALGL